VNLESVPDDVHDPVVRNARPRIQTGLVVAIDSVGALRDLDDQYGAGRMRDQGRSMSRRLSLGAGRA